MPRSSTLILVLTSLVAVAHAQPITSERLAPGQALPAPIKATGKVLIGAWKFTGPTGTPGHLVMSSTSRSAKTGESRQLFAQLYEGTKPKQVRLVQDGVTNCKLDLVASFVQGSVAFEDIDGDGKVEVSFAYDLNCDATERPTPRKLLILEGTAKHALRGNGRGKDLDDKPAGGDYKADAFKNEGAIATWAEARWRELLDTDAVNIDP